MKNLLIGGFVVGASPLGTSWKLDLQEHKGIIIQAVWASGPGLEESIRQSFPEATLVDELQDLLTDPEIDLVLIAPSLDKEQPVVGQLLQSGKHVRIL